MEVAAGDIILRDITNNDQNEVEFSMFVQVDDGASVLSVDTLLAMIMVCIIILRHAYNNDSKKYALRPLQMFTFRMDSLLPLFLHYYHPHLPNLLTFLVELKQQLS